MTEVGNIELEYQPELLALIGKEEVTIETPGRFTTGKILASDKRGIFFFPSDNNKPSIIIYHRQIKNILLDKDSEAANMVLEAQRLNVPLIF